MDRADPALLVAGQRTVSDRIRALHRGGYSRAEIARLLNKRYQHVRNVLVEDERRSTDQPGTPPVQRSTPGGSEVAESPAPYHPQSPANLGPVLGWLDIEPSGVVRLTDTVKQALGVVDGGCVLAEADGEGSVKLLSPRAAMLRAQEIIRPYLPRGVSAVDQFLADRRVEAAREDE